MHCIERCRSWISRSFPHRLLRSLEKIERPPVSQGTENYLAIECQFVIEIHNRKT
jgi:hypothetical protein